MMPAETYGELMTNGAHWEWELTAWAVQDLLLGLVLLPVIKRRLKARFQREHALLDAEHGHSHEALPKIQKGSIRSETVSNVRVLDSSVVNYHYVPPNPGLRP